MRLRIPEEELLTHFADPPKKYCGFDELEIKFSMPEVQTRENNIAHLVTV